MPSPPTAITLCVVGTEGVCDKMEDECVGVDVVEGDGVYGKMEGEGVDVVGTEGVCVVRWRARVCGVVWERWGWMD